MYLLLLIELFFFIVTSATLTFNSVMFLDIHNDKSNALTMHNRALNTSENVFLCRYPLAYNPHESDCSGGLHPQEEVVPEYLSFLTFMKYMCYRFNQSINQISIAPISPG